jgi:hypothetical protein
MEHSFIFTPGNWNGKGTITFSMAEDELAFQMHWKVKPMENDRIQFTQLIQVEGFPDSMLNTFCIFELKSDSFVIELENQIIGIVRGTGLRNDQHLAWEFKNRKQAFEGYEIYEIQENGDYRMCAEFTAGTGLYTHVKGVISLIQGS